MHSHSDGQFSSHLLSCEDGGTRSKALSLISKQIWDYLIDNGIMITAEYLPGKLNIEADRESRSVTDSSEWKLNPVIFGKICRMRWLPDIDLYASWVSHQVPAYMSSIIDPFSKGRELFRWNGLSSKHMLFHHFV